MFHDKGKPTPGRPKRVRKFSSRDAASEHYWAVHSVRYPHQVIVPHMSAQDPKPGAVFAVIGSDFLRVPFGGLAYWGFETAAALKMFKQRYNVVENSDATR